MRRPMKILLMLCMALLLSGCGMRTVDEMYSLPKRSKAYSNLQSAIDTAMAGLEYAAPDAGENQQTVQQSDLNGDGQDEYLLFARGNTEKPLRILIFSRTDDHYDLVATIENAGFSFEQVEYVDIDDRPGVEIVVGCQVSDQVLRSLTVYTFAEDQPAQLMSANYSKFLTCDLDSNGSSEVMLLQPGETEADSGVAVLYRFRTGEMERSREVDLSESVDNVKRIIPAKLQSGEAAVYVASAAGESAVITDIFALKYGQFTNISFSSEAETSVQTLRNYYVYADDIDNDGVLELPSLITMVPLSQERMAEQQYLIRWFSMDLNGAETDKRYTYHNFAGGWYLELTSGLAQRTSVRQEGSSYSFHLWDEAFRNNEKLLTVYALTGPNREDQALIDDRFVLYRGDGVLYAARLEDAAHALAITQEELINRFHLIHHDWKTGET